jgi:hypothetical protein
MPPSALDRLGKLAVLVRDMHMLIVYFVSVIILCTISTKFSNICYFLCSVSAYWVPYAIWSTQHSSRTHFTLWCPRVHCRRRHDLHAILGRPRFKIFSRLFLCDTIISIKLTPIYPSDDAKSSFARRRYGVYKKCQPPKGHICEAAASYNWLLGHFKSQSNVSIVLIKLFSFPWELLCLILLWLLSVAPSLEFPCMSSVRSEEY